MQTVRDKIHTLLQVSYAKYFSLTFVPLLLFFAYTLYSFYWTVTTTIAFVIGYLIIYVYGINIFYHRYWSHRQFKPNPLVLKFFTLAGTMAMIGGPAAYAMAHRWHHMHSDTELDPHSPAHGRWHAFIGWTFTTPTTAIPISVIKDFFLEENKWIFVIEKIKVFTPWLLTISTYVISPEVAMGILAAMFLTHLIELYINAFLHDPTTHEPLDVHPIIGWLTAGGLTHKLHHNQPGKPTKKDPGYYFVRLVDTQ